MTQDQGSLIEQMLGVAGASAKARADQAQLRAGEVDRELNRETDPSYVTDLEHFEGMTHQEIYDAVQRMDIGGLRQSVETWVAVSTSITTAFQLNALGVSRAMHGKWEGAAAEAAHSASRLFALAGDVAADVAKSVGNRLDSAAHAAEALRAAVEPPPVAAPADPDSSVDSVLPGLVNGAKTEGDDQAVAAARARAVAAMNNIYLPTFPPAGENVPTFQAPPPSGTDPASSPQSSPVASQPPSSTDPASPTSDQPANDQPGAPANPGQGDPAKRPDPSTTPTSTDTNPAGAPPNSSNAAGPRVPDGSSPGQSPGMTNSPPGQGLPGAGQPTQRPGGAPGRTPLSPGGGSSAGGPGASRPGSPIGGSPGAGSASSRPVGGGSAGSGRAMGPMAPMAPGAAGRRQDDERERSIPDYLVRQQPEWTEGLQAPPEVIGMDAGDHVRPDANSPDEIGAPTAATLSNPNSSAESALSEADPVSWYPSDEQVTESTEPDATKASDESEAKPEDRPRTVTFTLPSPMDAGPPNGSGSGR